MRTEYIQAQFELVWGMGMGVKRVDNTKVSYPIIGKLIELSLNATTASLEIRPRDVAPRIELDWYASQNNPGVADLEESAKKFFNDLPNIFSPFERSSYEPLLMRAATHLDVNGVYWPCVAQPEDRTVPKVEESLKSQIHGYSLLGQELKVPIYMILRILEL